MWVRVSRCSEAPQDRPCALASPGPPPMRPPALHPTPRGPLVLGPKTPPRVSGCWAALGGLDAKEGLGLIPPRVLANLAGPPPTLDAKGRDALVRRGRGVVSLRKGPHGAVLATVHGSSGARRG